MIVGAVIGEGGAYLSNPRRQGSGSGFNTVSLNTNVCYLRQWCKELIYQFSF